MILASRFDGSRDGEPLLVSQDRARAVSLRILAPSLQQIIDRWETLYPALQDLRDDLVHGSHGKAFPLEGVKLTAPLPRAYAWLDGSAYLEHVRLARRARGVEPPPQLETDPLMYQGASDNLLGPRDPIVVASESWGIDFEAEVVVLTDDVPMGVSPAAAARLIRLVGICNDVSLRELIPAELAKGFGFIQSKPPTAFAPFLVTPDELGDAWRDARLHLTIESRVNGQVFGTPETGAGMAFSFAELVAHAAKTRSLAAGTLIGSGTVASSDRSRGSSCIVERRMLEKLESGEPRTSYLKYGDIIEIEVRQGEHSVFGRIQQQVVPS